MANQHTRIYNNNEINSIIDLYSSGLSFTNVSLKLNINKRAVKKILKDNSVWVEGRDAVKKELKESDVVKLYNSGLSLEKVGKFFNVSKTVIRRIVNSNGSLREGNSDGVKINLSEEQKKIIKDLYLNEYKNIDEMSEITNLTPSFISKYLTTTNYRRNKSEATSLSKKGVKLSDNAKKNMRIAQQKLARSGKRVQVGGVCKQYIVNDITCYGTYEKWYLEHLISNNKDLPENTNSIITPHGVYYPDFEANDELIEIKSDYTYEVLIGNKISRWSNKIETNQYDKIKWVNENVKPVNILVVDKRNNTILKKNNI